MSEEYEANSSEPESSPELNSEPSNDELLGTRGPPPGAPKPGCPECGSTRRHKKECSRAGNYKSAGTATKAASINVSDVAAAWLGAWFIIRLIAKAFGYVERSTLTNDEAESDARQLVPVVRNFPMLLRVMAWLAAPIIVMKRVTEKFEKIKKEPRNVESLRPGIHAS